MARPCAIYREIFQLHCWEALLPLADGGGGQVGDFINAAGSSESAASVGFLCGFGLYSVRYLPRPAMRTLRWAWSSSRAAARSSGS